MLPLFRFYAYNLVYWLILSIAARLVFVLFYWSDYPGDSIGDLLRCFRYGFLMDLSMASYIVALCFLPWMIFHLFRINTFFIFYKVLGILITGIVLLITLADVAVYHHWAIKINLTAIQFAQHPREVFASIGKEDHVPLLVLVYVILMAGFVWLWLKITGRLNYTLLPNKKNLLIYPISFVLISGLYVLGIRGGIQLAPINQSSVYFSEEAIYNHTAVNSTWNLMHKWVNYRDGHNPYHYGNAAEIEESLRRFYTSPDQYYSLVDSTTKPNIVFVLLEGFTADVIEAFGGESGLTPAIDSLLKNGLIFTQFYSNGDRTYKGLPSILNGYPSQATSSITRNPDVTGKISSIAKTLEESNYGSSFYYGGESEFANIKSYLLNSGFDKIVDIRDFPSSYRGLKWGVSDHYVFEKMSRDLSVAVQPFFSCILTLSSHEPYDIPMEPKIHSKTIPDLFRNTVYYTDWSLGQFIQLSEKQPWYSNTLFILTADHGNPLPKEYPTNFDPGRFKIPLVIFGNPLKQEYKGKRIDLIGSHTDIANTVLQGFGVRGGAFKYSKNLLANNVSGAAFYTFDNGFGLINSTTKLVFDHVGNRVMYQEGPVTDSLLLLGKHLLQGTFKPL